MTPFRRGGRGIFNQYYNLETFSINNMPTTKGVHNLFTLGQFDDSV
jgi:hypothetical protein